MEPFNLLFGGLFDLNGDGVMDTTEDFIAYTIINGDDNESDEDD